MARRDESGRREFALLEGLGRENEYLVVSRGRFRQQRVVQLRVSELAQERFVILALHIFREDDDVWPLSRFPLRSNPVSSAAPHDD